MKKIISTFFESVKAKGERESALKPALCCRVAQRFDYTGNVTLEIVYHYMTADGSDPFVILSGEVKINDDDKYFVLASSPDGGYTIEEASEDISDFLTQHNFTDPNQWSETQPSIMCYALSANDPI